MLILENFAQFDKHVMMMTSVEGRPFTSGDPCVSIVHGLLRYQKVLTSDKCPYNYILALARHLNIDEIRQNKSLVPVDTSFISSYYYYYICLTAFFPGQPGLAGTRKVKPIWIYWSKRL